MPSGQSTEHTLWQLKELIAAGSASVSSALGEGRKTVSSAGTAEALASSTTIKEVIVTAETNNTGVMCAGGGGVVAAEATREGEPLFPGDSVVLQIDDLAAVYIDTTVNGDGVTYIYRV